MADKKRNNKTSLAQMRNYKIIKSNDLIQKRTHMLSIQEQKVLLFLISQLKHDQEKLEQMTFDIIDFCEMCGIDSTSGKNYHDLKKTIQKLGDKSMWLLGENQEQTLTRWIEKAIIKPKSGQIEIKLDNDLAPFLLQLKKRYTQFDLIYTLGMKSKYSIRLYEILKSYQNKNETIHFYLDRFKELVGAEYNEWYDIKRFVVEPALKEINKLSDIFVTYEAIKKGRSVTYIDFEIIEKKNFSDKVATRQAIAKELDGIEPIVQIKGQFDLSGKEQLI